LHQRRLGCIDGRRAGVADEQRRQQLGELGKLDGRRRCFADGNDLEMAGDLSSGGKRENRRRVVKIPDRQTRGAGGIEPERASAARSEERRVGKERGYRWAPGHETSKER